MKEVKHIQIDDKCAAQKIMLPENSKILSVYWHSGLQVVYEKIEIHPSVPEKEITIHTITSSDIVPSVCNYIGTVLLNDIPVHVYQEH